MTTRFPTRGLTRTLLAVLACALSQQAVATEDETERLRALMAQGKVETDLGHFDVAIRALTAVVEAPEAPPPVRAEALVRLGVAHRAGGDHEAALRAFEQAGTAPGASSDTQALLVQALGGALPGRERWLEIWSSLTLTPDRSLPGRPTLRVVWPGVPATARRYQAQPISLELRDADVLDFFRMVADVSQLNVVVFPGVHGRFTFAAKEEPWDRCLEAVLAANGLAYQWEDNVVWISAPGQLLPPRRYTGRRIDVDWGSGPSGLRGSAERDLREGLAELAAVGGLQVELDPKVAGQVTLRLSRVRWDHAFDIVTHVNGLEWTRDGDNLKVFPRNRGTGAR
jgi:hypothetical protein